MSNTDSFIDEVNEEVRRDKLYAMMRKWGWLPVVIIVAAVGGTAFNEYRKAEARATAQALGDGILQAAQEEDVQARLNAFADVAASAEGPVRAPIALLEAGARFQSQDPRGAIAALEPLTTDQELSPIYRDLAALRLVSQGGDAVPGDIRADLIDRISAPGAPFRLLGLEQRALLELEQGNRDAAVATLTELMQETGVTASLLQRSGQLLAALGAEAPSAIAQ